MVRNIRKRFKNTYIWKFLKFSHFNRIKNTICSLHFSSDSKTWKTFYKICVWRFGINWSRPKHKIFVLNFLFKLKQSLGDTTDSMSTAWFALYSKSICKVQNFNSSSLQRDTVTWFYDFFGQNLKLKFVKKWIFILNWNRVFHVPRESQSHAKPVLKPN